MAKILCITSGLTGILNASFELVARLKAAGHQVVYAAPAPVEESVLLQGISFQQLPAINQDPGPGLPAFKKPFEKIARLIYKIKWAGKRRKEALENSYPHAFSKLLKEQSPDLLIIDIELHEYIFKAYSEKVSFILLSQWFSLWKRKGLPYLLHDTIPGKGWKGKKGMIALSWQLVRWKRWWMFFKKQYYSVFTDRRTILLDLAKKEGFPLPYIRENNWPGPFTYDQLPVISMTARELEFPHDVRPNLFYVGPMVCENRIEVSENDHTLRRLTEVFHYQTKNKASLIYCSVSTLQAGDHRFIEKLIKAVEKEKKWVLILGMGGLIQEELLGQLPQNVFSFAYVPQLKVLKQADCSINHGGIHTINECLHFKVPMLVYSGKRSDQNGCAARVHFHGLGIRADKDKDNPEKIRLNIKRILEDSSYKLAMEKIHRHYVQYKKERCLEKTIDVFLAADKKQVVL